MTDGGIYLGDVDGQPLELKRYEIQDGLGIAMLRLRRDPGGDRHRPRLRERPAARARSLASTTSRRIPTATSSPAFTSILERRGIPPDEVRVRRRRLSRPCAAARRRAPGRRRQRGARSARESAASSSTQHGGRGAVREFVEDFLKARGEWDVAWNRYVDARSPSRRREARA